MFLINDSLLTERELSSLRYSLVSERYWIRCLLVNPSTPHQSRLRDLVLSGYRSLPIQPGNYYDGVLHAANQLNELSVSMQCVRGLKTQKKSLAGLMKVFSESTMNSWDPLNLWEDILVWRETLCKDLMKQLGNESIAPYMNPVYPALLLSRAARSQGLPGVALEYLASYVNDASSPMYVFEKWKERAMISMDLNQHDPGIFTELERMKMDSLNSSQMSSCQYIRGLYAMKENHWEDAVTYFSKSVHTNQKYYKAWESWSGLIYKQWLRRQDVNDANQFINCCFQMLAMRPEGMHIVPSFLHVLFSHLDCKMIVSTVAKYMPVISPSVWLHFLPFFLSRPSEAQFAVFQRIIKGLAQKFFQTVFYPLYALALSLGMPCSNVFARPTMFYEGTIGCGMSEGMASGSYSLSGNARSLSSSVSGNVRLSPLSMPSNARLPDLSASRRPNPFLGTNTALPSSETTVSLRTVTNCFNSLCTSSHISSQLLLFIDTLHATPHDPYRELLASVDWVLQEVYSEVAIGGPQALASPVSATLRQRLSTLCTLQFNFENVLPSTMAFLAQFSGSFHQDFNPMSFDDPTKPNPLFPDSLQVLFQRLLLWKKLAIQGADDPSNMFTKTYLWNSTRFLPYTVEMPGLHITSFNRQVFTLQNMHSYSPALYREPHAHRHVEMVDEEGRAYRFYLEQINSVDSIVEERTLYFQVFFRSLLLSSQPAQMRHLTTTLPSFVSITPTLRLVRSSPFATTLEGVYQEALGAHFDEKQLEFAMRLFFVDHGLQEAPEAMRAWASCSPEALLESVCPSTLLSQFV